MSEALDWKHNQAIRREVGGAERLSFLLSSTSNELPTRLRDLCPPDRTAGALGKRGSFPIRALPLGSLYFIEEPG